MDPRLREDDKILIFIFEFDIDLRLRFSCIFQWYSFPQKHFDILHSLFYSGY